MLGEVTGLKGLDKYPVALSAIAQKVLGLRSSYSKAVEGAIPRSLFFYIPLLYGLASRSST